VCIYPFLGTFHMPRPSHSPACGHPNDVWWTAQIMKLLTVQFSPVSRHLLPLRPNYPFQHPTFKHLHFVFWNWNCFSSLQKMP
jgi:hypothetical protein